MSNAKLAGAAPFGYFERALSGRYLLATRHDVGVLVVSILAFLAILLSVFVLITTMSVMNGFRETLLSRILGVQGHVFVDLRGRTPDERAVIERIVAAAPGVRVAAPIVDGQALATANGVSTGVLVRGIRREDLAQVDLVASNLLGETGLEDFRRDEDGVTGIVVGYRIAAQLGLQEGEVLTLVSSSGAVTPFGTVPRRKSYPIAAEFNVGMSEADALIIYMPLEEAQLFFARGEEVDRLELRLDDPDRAPSLLRALSRALPPDVIPYDWKAENDALAGALEVERNVMRLILMMIVAIASLTIISSMIMLVKIKSRDIAILRTMGATQGAILRVFLMTGASLGVCGAAVGIALSVLFCLNIGAIQDFVSAMIGRPVFPGDVYSLSRLPAVVEWPEVATTAGFAFLMSCLATLFPAWLASRLDPVEALRYE